MQHKGVVARIPATSEKFCAQDLFGDGCLRVRDAAAFLAISRARLYEHLRAGRIQFVKDGRRTLIPKRGLVQFLAERFDCEALK